MSNLEVSIALLLLERCQCTSVLCDDGHEAADEQQAAELLRSVREAVARLRAMGYGEDEILGVPEKEPELIHINRDYRITIPSREGEEIKLPPLLKTVFILFLKHPEGLCCKCLDTFADELLQIYETVAPDVEPDVRKKRIQRLVTPIDGTIYMVKSKLSRTLEKYFPRSSSQMHGIIGKGDGKKKIPLDRILVEWE